MNQKHCGYQPLGVSCVLFGLFFSLYGNTFFFQMSFFPLLLFDSFFHTSHFLLTGYVRRRGVCDFEKTRPGGLLVQLTSSYHWSLDGTLSVPVT